MISKPAPRVGFLFISSISWPNLKSNMDRSPYNICRSLWLLAIIALVVTTPAHGIRLVNVKLLFEISDHLNQPSDVAVSKNGQIYVVDGVNNLIRIYNSQGTPLSTFGTPGSGEGEFRYPLGVSIILGGGFPERGS